MEKVQKQNLKGLVTNIGKLDLDYLENMVIKYFLYYLNYLIIFTYFNNIIFQNNNNKYKKLFIKFNSFISKISGEVV